ncbi:Serine hydrolase-like protein [Pseudocercospora fuligena]|uniref:Serine hydrolase-like protein n=1 Tax=Pseudocercospora fuligena TaxID=685502 RepID=A0A8H6VGC4_9PEZI|nr:Serine hydrolase-like protein [Pseudocercospora fuligena]
MDIFNRPSSRTLCLALTAPALGYVAVKLVSQLLTATTTPAVPAGPRIYRAPCRRLLTPDEEWTIPSPDAFPGGRDIDTPYGNIRAYEWGPENGRKIMFVHGISTPCIALAKVAKLLVRKRCRVLLWDLPGRGYSDCPDPEVYRQDIKLFSAQMLAVLGSSKLDWMSGFTLVGYSLGGGISASFASYYPELVESLVLIAPGGLLRPTRLSLTSQILYSGVLPNWFVYYCVDKRLRIGGSGGSKPMAKLRRASLTAAVAEETPDDVDPHAPGQDSLSPIFDDRPCITPSTAVQWQLDVHPGFVPAFISSIKYAPIHDGWERWRLIGKRCEAKRNSLNPEPRGMKKVLVILGTKDVIIMPEETAEDATAALGKENVQIVKLNGGHDMPLTNDYGCVDAMTKFWDEEY